MHAAAAPETSCSCAQFCSVPETVLENRVRGWKMAQRLRTISAFAEDLGQVLSTRVASHNIL